MNLIEISAAFAPVLLAFKYLSIFCFGVAAVTFVNLLLFRIEWKFDLSVFRFFRR